MSVVEKLGQFYLGRVHDLASGVTSAEEVHYDAKDLTTHAVCVGMTGSGKTGLCLSLLEEAAIDGIPAICIDPKGDLGNLMLAFPGLTAEEFKPWVDPAEATRSGMTVEEYAKKTADMWRKGIAEWGQGPERIQKFRDSAEVAIYTPASTAGRPLTVLRSFVAPSPEIQNDGEALRERIMAAVSGLLALMQIDADPISSREHILLSTILEKSWREGRDVDMGTLIRSIQAPPFDKVGFLDLESFFPADDRFKLAMSLNNLLASPSFAAWLEGDALDVNKLFYTPEGKPRLAIVSIAHLSDEERMFFVTILLNEVLAWMRAQPGTSSLRALLYMDEVFGYFPPVANPPSKQPMLTLLKQARAYGLGCVLATQNPVDLDYKGLSNTGTWFLGRLQTERDKMRVLEGLEGAAASAGSTFDKQKMEQTLAGLGSRVFLMNNVHEDQPVVFKTRWALSYLRGPISRSQIETLMEPLKQASPQSGSGATFGLKAEKEDSNEAARPVLPPEIEEYFFPVRRADDGLFYRPALLGKARVHFVSTKQDVDRWDEVTLLQVTGDDVPPDLWHEADEWDEDDFPQLENEPEADAGFRNLAADLTQKKSYSKWESSLKDFLYRNRRLPIWTCPALDATSHDTESESDFRIRLRHAAREERDLQVEKLRSKYASKIRTLEDQIRRAEQKIEREKSQKSQKTVSAGLSVLTSIAGAIFGRKVRSVTNVSRAGTAIRSASSIRKEAEDVRHAEEALSVLLERHRDLNAEIEDEVHMIQDKFDPDLMELSQDEVKPRKSDVNVEQVVLVWLPYSVDSTGVAERAF
ncbi:ATP-binding protein [Fuerstiella marisgermanici]|uniref:Type IV secretory pathway, VirB4 component n=1 Tax=Fuerstiella marisgermanici TaxID=1891926 RepID=A0A1P8WBX5_9PLAN|nr:ATP-binding protein [Fuerstiella marisgermanici]APZ91513.1 Type IV secretory pathway, VirB4 component [Fuerstiella marisgermanici]